MEITNEKAAEEKKRRKSKAPCAALIDRTTQARATDVLFSKEKICVRLKDGREISVPLDWFPILNAASPKKGTGG